jgi:hypothetical protein
MACAKAVFTCAICQEELELSDKLVVDCCDKEMCRGCLGRYIAVEFSVWGVTSQSRRFPIRCLFSPDCGGQLSESMLNLIATDSRIPCDAHQAYARWRRGDADAEESRTEAVEREIDALHSMFPQIDRQTIAAVLEEQQGIPNAVFDARVLLNLRRFFIFGCGRAHGEGC